MLEMIANMLKFNYVVQLKGNQINLNKMIKNGLKNKQDSLSENIANSVLVIEQAIAARSENTADIASQGTTTCLENIAKSPMQLNQEATTVILESTANLPLATETAEDLANQPLSCYEYSEENHGRRSQWKVSVYAVSSIPDPQKVLSLWTSIKTVICVQRIVEHTSKKNKKKDYNSKAYYISNHTSLNAEEFHKGIRGHWSIENGLHYEKDVVLNEDKNRIKNKSAAPIFSTFNTFAINFLRMLNFKGIRDATIKFGFNFKELIF